MGSEMCIRDRQYNKQEVEENNKEQENNKQEVEENNKQEVEENNKKEVEENNKQEVVENNNGSEMPDGVNSTPTHSGERLASTDEEMVAIEAGQSEVSLGRYVSKEEAESKAGEIVETGENEIEKSSERKEVAAPVEGSILVEEKCDVVEVQVDVEVVEVQGGKEN